MITNHSRINNVKKIAVLRANALGDLIVTLPAFKALRDTYPGAEIVLLGKPWHKQFVIPGRTVIDRVAIVPVKKGIRSETNRQEDPAEVIEFVEEMRKESFDLVVNFQGNGNSANSFIKTFGAKMTVGLAGENAEPLDRSTTYYYYQNEVLRFMEVAKLAGASANDFEPRLNILEQDIAEITPFLSELKGRRYVVLHPVAMDIRRMWPIENYVPLANWLRENDVEVIFTGTGEDKEKVEIIIENMSHPAINACGLFSLGGLAGLLSKAALMIGADTGPMHLARSVNTPTVGLYWAPNLINWGPLSRSIHRPLISWTMSCPYCGIIPNDPYPFEPQTSGCHHEVSFVRDISVEEVKKAAAGLLQVTSKSKVLTD